MTTYPYGRTMLVALVAVAGLMGLPWQAQAAPTFLGPTPYLSFVDSPFNVSGFTYFHLETFEDGVLNTPGATASPGWTVLNPGVFTDSVDRDDGTIDGSGTSGRSFYSSGSQTSVTITFNAAALGGNLPTHAGIVWTDVGDVLSGTSGFGDVTLSALDAMSLPLGSITGTTLGDGTVSGATAEDRFFGVTNAAGILSITISMNNSIDWEVDHLQYGFADQTAVPEPATLTLCGLGMLALLGYNGRRKKGAPL